MKRLLLATSLWFAFAFSVAEAQEAAPNTIGYTGLLTTAGEAIDNGDHEITFRLYV